MKGILIAGIIAAASCVKMKGYISPSVTPYYNQVPQMAQMYPSIYSQLYPGYSNQVYNPMTNFGQGYPSSMGLPQVIPSTSGMEVLPSTTGVQVLPAISGMTQVLPNTSTVYPISNGVAQVNPNFLGAQAAVVPINGKMYDPLANNAQYYPSAIGGQIYSPTTSAYYQAVSPLSGIGSNSFSEYFQ